MADFDAREFLSGGGFLKKGDLRVSGPQQKTIQRVEQAEVPARNGKPATTELQAVFADDTRLGLSTQTNLRRLIEGFGTDYRQWVGRTIEVYFSPDVVNPSGGEPGGIRVRVLGAPPSATMPLYRSDLEDTTAKKSPATTTRMDDEIGF